MLAKLKEHGFLFSELVKRDFKKKYKNTYLGMIWSLLSPLLTLLVMSLVFKGFFGRNMETFGCKQQYRFVCQRNRQRRLYDSR